MRFYDSLNFKKTKKICMEKVAGEQDLALQQHFTYKFFKFSEDSDHHKISFSDDGGLKLGHFDIFDMLFPFLTFCKL